MDGKSKNRITTSPPDVPPELIPGYDADMHSLIHEDERE
jgi:hypothetical protein